MTLSIQTLDHEQRKLTQAREDLTRWAADPDLRFMAISTTALRGAPVDVVILNASGDVLLEQFIHPLTLITPESGRIHGLTREFLFERGVPFEQALPLILQHLTGETAVFNKGFVNEIFKGTIKAEGQKAWEAGRKFTLPSWDVPLADVQGALTPLIGRWNDLYLNHHFVSLDEALKKAGLDESKIDPHRSALGNAQRLRLVVQHYAQGVINSVFSDVLADAVKNHSTVERLLAPFPGSWQVQDDGVGRQVTGVRSLTASHPETALTVTVAQPGPLDDPTARALPTLSAYHLLLHHPGVGDVLLLSRDAQGAELLHDDGLVEYLQR